jgi:HK97 family phage prohead protease
MNNMIYKLHVGPSGAQDSTLNDRQIRVVASDPTPDRVGDIMVPEGCVLDGYKANPIVLANHDADKPIGSGRVMIKSDRVEALITFAPPKISKIADEFCALTKAGILNAVSVGFEPIEAEPLQGGGVRYKVWELLELSVVSVPANPLAVVVERDFSRARRSATTRPTPARRAVSRPDDLEYLEEQLRERLRRDLGISENVKRLRAIAEKTKAQIQEQICAMNKEEKAAWPPPMPPQPIWHGSDAEYMADWREYQRMLENPYVRH